MTQDRDAPESVFESFTEHAFAARSVTSQMEFGIRPRAESASRERLEIRRSRSQEYLHRKLAWPNGRTSSANARVASLDNVDDEHANCKGERADFLPTTIQESSRRRVSISMLRARARRAVPFRSFAALASGLGFFALSTIAHADPSKLPPEVGYNYDEIETARTAGTGGAMRAAGNSITALFTNPANLVSTRVYHIGAFVQLWPEANRQSYGAGAVDSVVSSARVAGGVGATYNFQDKDGMDRRWTDIRFALAYPVSDQFFVGLGGRYMMLDENGFGPLGTSLASSGLPNAHIVRNFTFDAGATFKPSEHFAVAVVGNNLTNPDFGYQPTSVGGGFSLGWGDFGGEADVLADFTTWERTTMRMMAGLEGLFADHVVTRLGYRYDSGAKSNALSGGLGYSDRSFDLDVSVRHTLSGDSATAVVVGFTYHLDATGLVPTSSDAF
jgi:hypothetical protein